MIILDFIGIIALILLILNFHLNKKEMRSVGKISFKNWIFLGGFFGYFLKFLTIIFIIGLSIARIDWSFLLYEIF